jgi:hypothetical protein
VEESAASEVVAKPGRRVRVDIGWAASGGVLLPASEVAFYYPLSLPPLLSSFFETALALSSSRLLHSKCRLVQLLIPWCIAPLNFVFEFLVSSLKSIAFIHLM